MNITEIHSVVPLIVASGAAVVTFLITRMALQNNTTLPHPTLIALAVSALAFIAIWNGGKGIFQIILLPYAALGLALLFLALMGGVIRMAQIYRLSVSPNLWKVWKSVARTVRKLRSLVRSSVHQFPIPIFKSGIRQSREMRTRNTPCE
jgi:hypothetical protein